MLDRVGTVVAGLCAVHCALVPIAIATTSSFTLALLSWRDPHHGFAMWLLRISAWETWVVAAALVFASVSLGLHFPMHRDARPAVLLLVAAIAFACALYLPALRSPVLHGVLAVLGGFLLISAHLTNLRATRRAHR